MTFTDSQVQEHTMSRSGRWGCGLAHYYNPPPPRIQDFGEKRITRRFVLESKRLLVQYSVSRCIMRCIIMFHQDS